MSKNLTTPPATSSVVQTVPAALGQALCVKAPGVVELLKVLRRPRVQVHDPQEAVVDHRAVAVAVLDAEVVEVVGVAAAVGEADVGRIGRIRVQVVDRRAGVAPDQVEAASPEVDADVVRVVGIGGAEDADADRGIRIRQIDDLEAGGRLGDDVGVMAVGADVAPRRIAPIRTRVRPAQSVLSRRRRRCRSCNRPGRIRHRSARHSPTRRSVSAVAVVGAEELAVRALGGNGGDGAEDGEPGAGHSHGAEGDAARRTGRGQGLQSTGRERKLAKVERPVS